ncbi:hypothetical protein GW797_07900 [Candidatus Parcubacteria bacterium]|nr:hypothetical protein [Candidatus Parcubacteria bacterium]
MAIFSGQPQKLPYLQAEKKVPIPKVTKKMMIGKFKELKFKLIFPSSRALKSQQNRETKTKNKSRACLLKSKTFAVQGKKKIGRINTNK